MIWTTSDHKGIFSADMCNSFSRLKAYVAMKEKKNNPQNVFDFLSILQFTVCCLDNPPSTFLRGWALPRNYTRTGTFPTRRLWDNKATYWFLIISINTSAKNIVKVILMSKRSHIWVWSCNTVPPQISFGNKPTSDGKTKIKSTSLAKVFKFKVTAKNCLVI